MTAEKPANETVSKEDDTSATFPPELAMKVDDLLLSVRASNVLKVAGIEYVGDLIQLTEKRLTEFQNCGRKTIDELREKLAELGFTLGMELDGFNRPVVIPNPVPAPPRLSELDEYVRTALFLRADEIGFSQRARNVLKAAGIEFLGDLVGKTERDLRGVYSCGRLTISEIKKRLCELGLALAHPVSDWCAADARRARAEQDNRPGSPIQLLRRSLKPLPKQEYLEDELRALFACVANERDTEMGLKQLGWSGKGQRTLESVGQEFNLTRERVRQIVSRKTAIIRHEFVDAPKLDEALAAVRNLCPATPEDLASQLRKLGISKADFDPTGLQSACDVLQRKCGFERMYLRGTHIFISAGQEESVSELFKLCRKLTSSRGCANFDALCDELRIPESRRNRYRAIATVGATCAWLDEGQTWLFSTDVPRNRLSNLISKILCVAPQLSIAEMRKALARSKRLAVAPPVAILAEFLKRFGLAEVEDGYALARRNFSDAILAGSAEHILVSVLSAHGPLLGWDRFQELCLAEGMNPITFNIYVSGSPVIARVARGIYSVVGADIPPGAVEDLTKEIEAARKPVEWGWSPNGTLWYALPISGTTLAAGSVPAPPFVADIAEGEWTPRFDGRDLDGIVKCNNRFIWGLRRPLLHAGAEPGDTAVLEFEVSKRSVNIMVGGEELADMWDSGQIDLPSPEPPEEEATNDAESDSSFPAQQR